GGFRDKVSAGHFYRSAHECAAGCSHRLDRFIDVLDTNITKPRGPRYLWRSREHAPERLAFAPEPEIDTERSAHLMLSGFFPAEQSRVELERRPIIVGRKLVPGVLADPGRSLGRNSIGGRVHTECGALRILQHRILAAVGQLGDVRQHSSTQAACLIHRVLYAIGSDV